MIPPPVRCPFCRKTFQPSPYRPDQRVCGQPSCQQQRRREYHRQHRSGDTGYRDTCRISQAKWREAHPEYLREYRQQHPACQQQNRERQPIRDAKRRLRRSVLEKNTLASTQVLLLQSLPSRAGAGAGLEKNTHLDPTTVLTV